MKFLGLNVYQKPELYLASIWRIADENCGITLNKIAWLNWDTSKNYWKYDTLKGLIYQ